ncbi:hypothetical protein LTR16_002283 [Cryomyces antarcticus]|uniref:3-hydroxyisobutyrate dehydrogenase n=1 Tax=Cryomyces antarcticus TaxID=329879 RepID=A0ABR0M124_9PEZI|nr:hypothetical protein LTR60_004308 [Cryomyces antarcticus]KAK5016089.1 hypothetical protein LTR39_002264 [Cryomyces antarcticus]KAK5170809.1 hypothetical protein LTR04_003398 [Oleoguttula sp. CCFEE 6159]KAK5256832.1 hypothetical protein LTR16_002283 [Cryomyces antarcticus]
MSDKYRSVGFVGLGAMGYPMAQQLAKKLPNSSQIYVFDVIRQSIQKLCSQENGRFNSCQSAKEVAERSEIIISMVPEGSHVRQVYLDEKAGVLTADVSGKLMIDMSTIDTATSNTVREQALSKYPSASFYDAPVSGGVLGAEKATLTIMLGCAEDDAQLPLLQDLLGMMGKSIFPCGGPSLGLTAKLCNNYCSGLIAIATSEALNIGMRSGMDPRVLANIFHTSTAQSAICDKWNPVPGLCPEAPASHGYQAGFKVQLMKKDFGLAVDTAERVGARLALGKVGLEVYEKTSEDPECRDLDSRVVYRYLGGKEDWEKDFASGKS